MELPKKQKIKEKLEFNKGNMKKEHFAPFYFEVKSLYRPRNL